MPQDKKGEKECRAHIKGVPTIGWVSVEYKADSKKTRLEKAQLLATYLKAELIQIEQKAEDGEWDVVVAKTTDKLE